jgi:glutamyl-tRNA synthetase
MDEDLENLIYKYALLNALKYNGKADIKAVTAKIFTERPELKPRAKEIVELVKKIVEKVNSMSIDDQRKELENKYPEVLREERKVEERKKLPPLPNVKEKVITRFAPNPDGPLHLGNARAAILSYEYAKMYDGIFILRFDDTDPKIKKPILEAYDWIKEDLNYLGIRWDYEILASKRLEIYYKYTRELIERGFAYVDLCKEEEFKKYKLAKKSCPHRNSEIEDNLRLWERMLNREFKEGEAVVRLKTDMTHPDPSQRDWVMLRIIDTDKHPHPITGNNYFVWPTYNFASAIDDYELKISHILRAKEHITNTEKQKWIYSYMKWEFPNVIEFGRLRLEGFMMSKSKIKGLLDKGLSRDDPRLPTLAALKRRGILPETIKDVIIEVGVKISDATISFDNIAAINRKKLDNIAKRIMFVKEPKEFTIDLPEPITTTIQISPGSKDTRIIEVKPGDIIYLDQNDIKDVESIRLLELCNVKIEGNKLKYINKNIDYAKKLGLKIVQWVKKSDSVKTEVIKPIKEDLEVINGVSENYIKSLSEGEIIQFVRFGFVRIDKKTVNKISAIFAHD